MPARRVASVSGAKITARGASPSVNVANSVDVPSPPTATRRAFWRSATNRCPAGLALMPDAIGPRRARWRPSGPTLQISPVPRCHGASASPSLETQNRSP